jgi:hypothetical protein
VLAALTAAAMMVTLSAMLTKRVLASMPLEDANCLVLLSPPLPPRKMHRTSHQCQNDSQNKQKSKEVYAQALMQAMMLAAAKRAQANENRCTTPSVPAQDQCKFQPHGFAVLLSRETVNCYVRNDMARSAPLLRGYYKGIVLKAVFSSHMFR